MAITEVLQGCGAWSLQWVQPPPKSVRLAIGVAPTLLVFSSQVGESEVTDALRESALFEGITTKIGSDGLSGWEAGWLLQKPNGDSVPIVRTNGDTVTNVRTHLGYAGQGPPGGIFWVAYNNGTKSGTGIVSGDLYNTTLTAGGFVDASVNVVKNSSQWGARTYLDGFVEQVSTNESEDFSWRINPGLTLDVNKTAALFRQLEVVFTDIESGQDGGEVQNIWSMFKSETSIEDSVYQVQRLSSDGTTLEGSPWPAPGAFTAPDNEPNNFWHLLPSVANSADAENYVTRAAESLVVKSTATVTAFAANIRDHVGPGDYVYKYDPEVDSATTTNSITHFGRVIHPAKMWVNEMTWAPTIDMSVFARTPTGEYVDLSRYVELSDPSTSARIGMSDVWAPAWTRSGNADVDRLGKNAR